MEKKELVVMDAVQAENHLEKVMQQLNPQLSEDRRRLYLGAVIDTLKDFGHITEDIRSALYPRYAN